MIVNREYKYVFIGFPYSASSAISKELVENYGGERLMLKHSTMLSLKGIKKYKDYKTIAVFRSPISVWKTQYIKLMKSSIFDNEKYLRSNGGHINRRAFNLAQRMREEDWSFNQYVKHKSRSRLPYVSSFIVNYNKLDFIIRYHELQYDWQVVMKDLGHSSVSPLPLYNATANKVQIDFDELPHFVMPFLHYTRDLHEYRRFKFNGVFIVNYILFYCLILPMKIYWIFQERGRIKSSLDQEYK